MITHPIRVLSLVPPMTQLNTPYPSTAYLTGFLRSRGFDAVQEDLALALVLKLFSIDGLSAIRQCAEAIPKRKRSPIAKAFLQNCERYLATISPTIAFLQARDPTLAYGATVPGALAEVAFMMKDSKRFPETDGWGYATFKPDGSSDMWKTFGDSPAFANTCHGCHTRVKARNFVFTRYQKR